MHTHPRNTRFADFAPFATARKARDLTAQLNALCNSPQGRLPANAQDVDASQTETYMPGLSRSAATAVL